MVTYRINSSHNNLDFNRKFKLFLQSLGISKQVQPPEPLYTLSYAGELAFGNENNNPKGR